MDEKYLEFPKVIRNEFEDSIKNALDFLITIGEQLAGKSKYEQLIDFEKIIRNISAEQSHIEMFQSLSKTWNVKARPEEQIYDTAVSTSLREMLALGVSQGMKRQQAAGAIQHIIEAKKEGHLEYNLYVKNLDDIDSEPV